MEIDKIGSEEEFYQKISKEHVIAIFTSSWCNPCKQLKELILKFDESEALSYRPRKDKPYIIEIDIDDLPKLAERFKIKGIPNLLTFHSGKLINQSIGMKKELFVSSSSVIKL